MGKGLGWATNPASRYAPGRPFVFSTIVKSLKTIDKRLKRGGIPSAGTPH